MGSPELTLADAGTEFTDGSEGVGRLVAEPASVNQMAVSGRREAVSPESQKIADRTQSRFLQLAENIPACFWLVDIAERRVVFANAAYEQVWGRRVDDLFNDRMDWMHAIHPDDLGRVADLVNKARRGGMDTEFRVVHGNSKIRWLHMRTFPIGVGDSGTHSVGGIAYDVTDFVLQQEALRTGEELQRRTAEVQRSVLDALPAQVAILDESGRILETNAQWRSFAEQRGRPDESIGTGHFYLDAFQALTGNATECLSQGITDVVSGGARDYCQIFACHDGKATRWFRVNFTPLSDAPPHGVLVTHIDITERMLAEQQLTRLAHYDNLTGLPNRFLFRDRLHSALHMARRNEWQLAVLFVDLDRFKAINDSMGHLAGDKLLQEAAQRIQSCIRETDTVGRLGGDEFALVLTELVKTQAATVVARKIVQSLARPFIIDGTEVFISASIGITLFPGDADDVDALIRNADTAMYLAKDNGRNNFQFFTSEMNNQATAKMQLESDLRRAVARQEFTLVYQPKVSCTSGQIIGFEALMRWQHPRRGVVSPADFISVLEETGMIAEAGEWVLRTACRDILELHRAGFGTLSVAVNLSGRQLQSARLFDVVKNALEESGLEPGFLELELTESFLMRKPETAIDTLTRLKKLGVHISIDDFGTGYSSLSYLKRFPIDALKVDRSFVQDITADPSDASITRAIITMAHSLKLQVVAEGVETEGQLALLIAHRCDVIQGYYFSRPVTLHQLREMLKAGKALPDHLLSGHRTEPAVLLVGTPSDKLTVLAETMRAANHRVITADNASEGVNFLDTASIGIVLCDDTVDEKPGAEFLHAVRQHHPGAVRLMLAETGNLAAAAVAINEGLAFRFVTAPWRDEDLDKTLQDAWLHYREAMDNEALAMQLHQSNAELCRSRDLVQRLQEKADAERERQSAVLDMAQNILERLPLPVLGVDRDGIVATANGEAEALFSNGMPLLGSEAAECLPPGLLAWQAQDDGDGCFSLELGGRRYEVRRRPMAGRYQGALLSFHAC